MKKKDKEIKSNNQDEAPSGNEKKPDTAVKKEEKKVEKKKETKPKTEVEILKEQIANLQTEHKKELEEKDKKISELNAKPAYLQAELENTRKYYIRQADMAKIQSQIKIITAFTPLIDSFEMALKSSGKLTDDMKCEEVDTFVKGIENLNQTTLGIFNSIGVKVIDALNKPFDYKYHEVILKIINDDLEEDTVVQVVQKGYLLNGDVLRPAKVIVSKKTPPPPPPPAPEKEEEKTEGKSEEKTEEKTEERSEEKESQSTEAKPTKE
jgi:molecular chaperone GrpE